jgi:hypothetical protein
LDSTEKDQPNKIKQQRKAIKADITKKKLSILEMRRYIKEKNKLYDDLTKLENELSTTTIFSSVFVEKTEEELKEDIANKIVRDIFLQYQNGLIMEIKRNILIFKTKNLKNFNNTKEPCILL